MHLVDASMGMAKRNVNRTRRGGCGLFAADRWAFARRAFATLNRQQLDWHRRCRCPAALHDFTCARLL